MTFEEANELVSDLSQGLIPIKYRWRGSISTLKVQGGWVRLGDEGIRAAVASPVLADYLPGAKASNCVDVRVLVGNHWYFLDTEEKE